MTDTPEHIKDLQLKIWLSRTPEERLLQFIRENDAWWRALKEAKEITKANQIKNNSGR